MGINLSISIVSHNQFSLVKNLLDDLQDKCLYSNFEVVLTSNIHEDTEIDLTKYSFTIKQIKNSEPKGFGANHNQAFHFSDGDYYCVLNPDIRIFDNLFEKLLPLLIDNDGVVAPIIKNPQGDIEDSARKFPTVMEIIGKVFGKKSMSMVVLDKLSNPDWVCGMFMLFSRQSFSKLSGFDEQYFLYYEDVDICERIKEFGMTVTLSPDCVAEHDARRDSHKKLKYAIIHIGSMLRYFLKKVKNK